MGLRIFFTCLLLLSPLALRAQTPGSGGKTSESASATGVEEVTPYRVVKQKQFPNYKVEIQQRMTKSKFPRVESMKMRIVPNGGGSVIDYTGTWVNPDPRAFAIGYEGGPFDLDGDGLEDVMIQNYTGGVHCCYNYVIYSLAKPVKKLGDIAMKDCGEKLALQDLNGDKKLEIISCNPDFTYLGDQPYSESPFPPAIYALKDGQYQRADREFRQVFLDDIQAQREALAKGYRPANALQVVADYLVLGDEPQAWKEFDSLYQGSDKDKVKQQLMNRVGVRPAVPAASPVVKPSAAYAPPASGW